jgi:hypothetical protein
VNLQLVVVSTLPDYERISPADIGSLIIYFAEMCLLIEIRTVTFDGFLNIIRQRYVKPGLRIYISAADPAVDTLPS